MKLNFRLAFVSITSCFLCLGLMSSTQSMAVSDTSHHKKIKREKVNQNNTNTLQKETQKPQSDTTADIYPTIDKIIFVGNAHISSRELLANIPLKINHLANEENITNAIVKIGQLYQAQHIKITITPLLQKEDNGHTIIQFTIHEINQ